MVAMLIGCGLRRAELLALCVESIQQREEHWVIADLVGKAGHVRTVPIPTWVKAAVDAWTAAAAITNGSVFRAINKAGRVWGDGMSPKVLWDVVRAAAARAGIDKLAPHDLRRTCARLCPYYPRTALILLRGRSVVEVQHAAHARPSAHRTMASGSDLWLDKLIANALMIPLRMVVRDELRDGAPKVALAEEQYAVQAFLFD